MIMAAAGSFCRFALQLWEIYPAISCHLNRDAPKPMLRVFTSLQMVDDLTQPQGLGPDIAGESEGIGMPNQRPWPA